VKYRLETNIAQIGNRSEKETGTVSTPIYLSTAYRHEGLGKSSGFDYSRTSNPTREIVESSLADLEKGNEAFAFSSGMAAIQCILSLFQSGDELIVSEDLYGGTYRLFQHYQHQYEITFHYVDTSNKELVGKKINENTKAIFVETPTNPLMKETDLKEIAKLTEKNNLLLMVDNTFYTPIIQQPISEGADIVIHSATKYLGGHNDVLAGAVIAVGEEICNKLRDYQNAAGAVLSPFDCWLLIRGIKTLTLRVREQEKNAKQIAEFLREHPLITDVFYPNKGGMLSFRIQKEEWVASFLEKLQLITFAESLGGLESFITYPATQTHADIPESVRIEKGICNRLLRFSVGIEHIDDLLEELKNVLSKVEEEVVTYE
jgi:cystathionine gamma-synthase